MARKDDGHDKIRAATPADTENARIWRDLMVTDPGATKPFDRGNFKGTDVSPMWRFKRLTETFGPAGHGWGVENERIEYVERTDGPEVMVYVTCRLWYILPDTKERCVTPPGCGGDFVRRETKKGVRFDDEALKKAMTDAICNATRYIGLSADVYMGLFDNSKYVNSMEHRHEQRAVEQKKSPVENHPGDADEWRGLDQAPSSGAIKKQLEESPDNGGDPEEDQPTTTPATEAEMPDDEWADQVVQTLKSLPNAKAREDFKESIRPRFLTLSRNLKIRLANAFKSAGEAQAA